MTQSSNVVAGLSHVEEDVAAQQIMRPCANARVSYGGNAMLTGACFCNDSLLSHAPAKEGLPQGVVDLVCPCVIQVFPLEVDFRSPILAAHVQSEAQHKLKLPTEASVCTLTTVRSCYICNIECNTS